MSTRGAICIAKGNNLICMYNHFDSYPEGLGHEILNLLKNSNVIKTLKENFGNIEPVTNEQIKELEYQAAGTKEDYEKLDYYAKDAIYNAVINGLHALRGSELSTLIAVLDKGEKQKVFANPDWPSDSLFCEYGYVIDLDNDMLEMYVGFNKKPVKGERFEYLNDVSIKNSLPKDTGEIYYPIRLAAKWSFDHLPDEDEMSKAAKNKEEELLKERETTKSKKHVLELCLDGEVATEVKTIKKSVSLKIDGIEVFNYEFSD